MDWSGWVNPETPKARAAGLMHPLQSLTIGTDEDTTPNPLTEHRSFLANAQPCGGPEVALDAIVRRYLVRVDRLRFVGDRLSRIRVVP